MSKCLRCGVEVGDHVGEYVWVSQEGRPEPPEGFVFDGIDGWQWITCADCAEDDKG